MSIQGRIDEIFDEMVAIRREFHQNPELSNEEYKTQNKILDYLKRLNIPAQKCAKTGVVGQIGSSGIVVALRADIDALPIQEVSDYYFKSVNPGVMHACGHDIHTTILLGVAKILSELQLNGTVKFLFQPAEETTGGALPMIDEGVLDNPKVDYVFGLHVMPYLEPGKIEIKKGQLNAASNAIKIKVIGKKGHGAYPESGVDAIIIAAHIVSALQSIVSRNTSPLNSVVLSLGSIHGGTKSNIICDEVILKGTMRTLNPETRVFMKNKIKEISELQAKSFGGICEVSFEDGYEALINNNDLIESIYSLGNKILGKENVVYKEYPSMGVEDFSYFSNRVPSAFFHLGCKKSKTDLALHNSNFDLDESCIKTGILMEVMLVLKQLNHHQYINLDQF